MMAANALQLYVNELQTCRFDFPAIQIPFDVRSTVLEDSDACLFGCRMRQCLKFPFGVENPIVDARLWRHALECPHVAKSVHWDLDENIIHMLQKGIAQNFDKNICILPGAPFRIAMKSYLQRIPLRTSIIICIFREGP